MDTFETKLNYITTEQDLTRRVTKTLEHCTTCIYSISNEPTLACFCIGEHLMKSGIQLTDKRDEMRKIDKKLTGALIDIDFSIDSIKMMKNSDRNFKSTQDMIKNALFCKQQIEYNNMSRKKLQQQMEMTKDHSVDDFRRLASGTATETKRNAFQRFSTSFEASFEGLASSASVDFKEFKEALNSLKNISQLTTSSLSASRGNQFSTSRQQNIHSNVNQPSTSNQCSSSSNMATQSDQIDQLIITSDENSTHSKSHQPTNNRIDNENQSSSSKVSNKIEDEEPR